MLMLENNFAAIAVNTASDKNDPVAVKSREKVPRGSGYLCGLEVSPHTAD